jgi:glycosyltransferase involved in cell wall biosynthesis
MSPHVGLNAHLLSAEAGYRRAGIHVYIRQLLEHLPQVDPNWRFRVYIGHDGPSDDLGLEVRRARMRTADPIRRITWEQAAQPWQLGGLDLMHELAFVAPMIMPCPFVVTVYDLSFIRYPERLPRLRRLYLRLFTGMSCRRARRVLAISQSTAEDLVTLLKIPREKIDLAIPGVDPRFCPLPAREVAAWRARKGLPNRFFLFVGTLEPRKNLPMLLRAYAALSTADREACHLVLAGGRGWMEDEIDQVIERYDLKTTVHLPGYVSDDELPWWYNAADALVYPSVFEGWGIPVSEAMACGKPAIVSDVSSLPEAVGETGLRLPPHDIAAWTEGLARCISDEVWRRKYGDNARMRAGQFTWRHTAEQTMNSYRKALYLNEEVKNTAQEEIFEHIGGIERHA